jgi:hypothetical protein
MLYFLGGATEVMNSSCHDESSGTDTSWPSPRNNPILGHTSDQANGLLSDIHSL